VAEGFTTPVDGTTDGGPRRFQILTFDGGGLKGLFAAAILAELESQLGVSLVDHFDLVAGTSTGGLIALALGAGLRPVDIVDFYVEHVRRRSAAQFSSAPGAPDPSDCTMLVGVAVGP
jgi:patatin-like phospholipase/acyl hydrolase